jgi:cysteinyl-tRNA synthetase
MALKLYNTLNRAKQEFVPIEPGKVKFYVCGPTVYDYIHVGNGRAFVVFDVLRKLLQHLKYDVTYVMNLTDIDDRIIERSIKEGISTEEITGKYTEAFFKDLDALGVQHADISPKATEHVADITRLIEELVDKGFAYQVDGDVYYDVGKFHGYGKLSGKKLDDLIAGSRVDVDERKRNPFDFALWKAQKPGEPGWESPWGVGRPGWHIECSAMSMKYLGQSFDIHAGGTDLIFPHHENEIAQSEAATQKPFVKHWLHNGFLQIEGAKMAKSLGNFKRVRDIVKVYPGNVIRLFFLQKHYRGPIDFTQAGLDAAKSASARLSTFFENLKRATDGQTERALDRSALSGDESKFLEYLDKTIDQLFEALQDDLDTPVAVSLLFDMVRETNKLLAQPALAESEVSILAYASTRFEDVNSIFGVFDSGEGEAKSDHVNSLMSLIIDVRRELRDKKEWELADKIRDELNKSGIVLEDKPDGTVWRINDL